MGVQTIVSYLDTNIAIFLHAGNTSRLTQRATEQIERAELLVSAQCGYEWSRLKRDTLDLVCEICRQPAGVCRTLWGGHGVGPSGARVLCGLFSAFDGRCQAGIGRS